LRKKKLRKILGWRIVFHSSPNRDAEIMRQKQQKSLEEKQTKGGK